jgi:hypothetical protein
VIEMAVQFDGWNVVGRARTSCSVDASSRWPACCLFVGSGPVRSYGITKGRFWNGPTGREIRAAGADAQLVALYLFTGPHSNAIGLYYLPFELLLKHLALPGNRIRKSLLDLDRLHFAQYDTDTEVVWVREMAHHQLGVLRPTDGRVKAASRLYAELPPNPYLGSFFDRYAADAQLAGGRGASLYQRGSPWGGLTPPLYPDPDPDPNVSSTQNARTLPDRTSPHARAWPMDEWLRFLVAEYPKQSVTSGHLTEVAFVDELTKDGRQPDLVFADMVEHLANQKRGYQWRVKRMVPRLERWLREGLWRQLHHNAPPLAMVSERSLHNEMAADAFVNGGRPRD